MGQRVAQLQAQWRWILCKRRLQRNQVQKRVNELRAARNISTEHIVEDRKYDLCCDLPHLSLDSAASALNAVAPHKKTSLLRNLGGAVQLLFGAIEGLTRLGGHTSMHSLRHAVQVLLVDLFQCSSVAFYRVVDQGAGRDRFLELGNEVSVPVSSIPVAAKLLTAKAWNPGGDSPTAGPSKCSVACTTVSSSELSSMRVVSWMETADAANLGKPEALVGAGGLGETAMCDALATDRVSGVDVRPAVKDDACFTIALRIGDSASYPEAIILMNRSDGPASAGAFTADECFVASWIGAHMANAIDDTVARLNLREARHSKTLLREAVRDMAKGEKAIEHVGRRLLKCDDAVLYFVGAQQNTGRPELVPAFRDVKLEERDGLYEYVEHLSATGDLLNVRQGQAGALERQLGMLPSPLRGRGRSMLCVPIVVPPNSNSCLPEGLVAVMQWRNAARGQFNERDCLLASEWALLASPALQLASTQAERIVLEERVLLTSAKRDALQASAKLLGSQSHINELVAAIMEHAKSLLEVERSTMFLVDRQRGLLRTMVADGIGSMNEISVPWDKGLAGACVQSKSIVNVRDAYADHRFNQAIDAATGFRTRTAICYPILDSKEQVIGVIQLINKVGDSAALPFTKSDEDLLTAFAGQIGIAIVNLRTVSDLRNELQLANGNCGTFERLSMQLAECGAMPTVPLLVREVQKLLCTSTGAIACTSYLKSLDNGLRPQLHANDRPPAQELQEEASRVAALFARGRAKFDVDATVEVTRCVLGDKLTARDVLTIVVVMPSLDAIAALRQEQTGKTETKPREASSKAQDQEEGLDGFVPGDVIGVLQLSGKRRNDPEASDNASSTDAQPASRRRGSISIGGAAEAAEEADRQKLPLFTADDIGVLSSIARTFGSLLACVGAREKRDASAALAEASIAASQQQHMLVKRFAQVGGAASSIEELFPLVRSFASALPCVACHLFLVGKSGSNSRNSHEGEEQSGGPGTQQLWTIPQFVAPEGKESDSLEYALATGGIAARGPQRIAVPLGGGILGACAVDGRSMLVQNALIDQNFESWIDEAVQPLPVTKMGTSGASIACVPLLDIGGSVVGVLQAFGTTNVLLGVRQVETMAVIAHLLSVTVQLLRASGKPASEQVVMQRAIADLQRESREVREQYLKQRRAIYERKDNSDMIANEASQARRGQVGNSSPTSRRVHQGPLPWQSPSKSTKVPHDTRVLRSSVSLPAVGRDVGVTGHSSESVMALSPTSQREPKESRASIVDAAAIGQVDTKDPARSRPSRYLCPPQAAPRPSVPRLSPPSRTAQAQREQLQAAKALGTLGCEAEVDATGHEVGNDPHANPYSRAGPLHPILDPRRPIASLTYVQPDASDTSRAVASRSRVRLHSNPGGAEEMTLHTAEPRGALTEKRERPPRAQLGLKRDVFGGTKETGSHDLSHTMAPVEASDRFATASKSDPRRVDITASFETKRKVTGTKSTNKSKGVPVDVVWDDLLRTVRDL